MKKFVLLTIAMLLTSCSALTPDPTLTPTMVPTDTATSTPLPTNTPTTSAAPVSTVPPEVKEYLDSIYPILNDISESGQELDELFYLASVRIEYLENESWLKLANGALDRMSQGADDIDAIENVPAEVERAHELFMLAAEELRQAIIYQYEVINGDFESAFTVTEHMDLHFEYVEAAFNEINQLQR